MKTSTRQYCCAAGWVQKLVDGVRGKGRILIVTHDNPDPDSLAAAVGLRHLLLLGTGEESVIAFGGIIGRSENRHMVESLELDLQPLAEIDLQRFALTCMVDTQPGAGNSSYPEDAPLHVLIDHHPPRRDYRDLFWADIREDYGASATIVFEYLRAQEIYLSTRMATALLYAIKSETQDLGREWSHADREAYLHLLPLANNQILYQLTRPAVPSGYFNAFHRAIENSTVYGGLLVFNLYQIDNPDLISELADFLLRKEGIDYVLGFGHYQEDELLSLRTRCPGAKLGTVISELLGDLGTAGGHGMMAGGQVRSFSEEISDQNELEHLLTRRLIKALQIESAPGVPLLTKAG